MRTLFGIPRSLSLDKLAGASLGLLGFAPLLAAAAFGSITALMSFAGMFLRRVAGHLIPVRIDILGGIALIVIPSPSFRRLRRRG